MKRSRDSYEAPEPGVESLASPFRRARGQIGSAPKRWKRYVARKVQRLLTTYFAAPEGLAEPRPWSPPSEADEPFEEEDTRSVRTSVRGRAPEPDRRRGRPGARRDAVDALLFLDTAIVKPRRKKTRASSRVFFFYS